MTLYGGIDLHSNNAMVSIIDSQDHLVFEKRLANDLQSIQSHLDPYRSRLDGLVVESTYNWYWLVDGLAEQGYDVHLARFIGYTISEDVYSQKAVSISFLTEGLLSQYYR